MQDMKHNTATWCEKSHCQCLPLECLKFILMKLLVAIQTHDVLGSPVGCMMHLLHIQESNHLVCRLPLETDPPLSCDL